MTSNNMRPKRRMVLLELQANMNDKARFKLRSIKLDSLSGPKTISHRITGVAERAIEFYETFQVHLNHA